MKHGSVRRPARALFWAKSALLVLLPVLMVECGGGKSQGSGGASGTGGGAGSVTAQPIVISTATRTPRTTTWSVNYWDWMPTYGAYVVGTETLIAPLTPAVMRVGGYNNDANTPNPFDDAALDTAVAYALAIGAEPLLQVPLLADIDGSAPTAASAAAMVTYANVTKGYGVKYFSIGNEPDIYAMSGADGSTTPSIPGYTPADYCTSARAYVTQMKSVDPSIKIVGPDLAYQYTAGSDWLTPILTGCGDLFDVVSIHRYPFSSAQASLVNAASDATTFRDVMTSVRGILQATGYGDKPLALTEMNIAYDATAAGSTLAAVPGTVPAGLWLADVLGSAIEANLWTSAVWGISDPPPYSMGLVGLPPAHTPRPAYYAYALYADHFGPTLVEVTSAPAGVRAYASRNQADDATEVILVNWNASFSVVSLDVTGLAKAPTPPVYALPPLSLAAVEIPDSGAATAWTYGEVQHQAGSGPQILPPGADFVVPDAGIDGSGGGGTAMACPQIVLPGATVTTAGHGSGTATTFGSGADLWGTFTFAAPGQTVPTIAPTADGNGLQITAAFVPATSFDDNYEGAGLYYDNPSCVDGSAYTGIQFDFSGDLGGCLLAFGVQSSEDVSTTDDANRGQCTATTCYGPSAAVIVGAQTIQVPFTSLSGGMPVATLDKTTITTFQWQLSVPIGGAGDAGGADAGGGCTANFTVENAAFY